MFAPTTGDVQLELLLQGLIASKEKCEFGSAPPEAARAL